MLSYSHFGQLIERKVVAGECFQSLAEKFVGR